MFDLYIYIHRITDTWKFPFVTGLRLSLFIILSYLLINKRWESVLIKWPRNTWNLNELSFCNKPLQLIFTSNHVMRVKRTDLRVRHTDWWYRTLRRNYLSIQTCWYRTLYILDRSVEREVGWYLSVWRRF